MIQNSIKSVLYEIPLTSLQLGLALKAHQGQVFLSKFEKEIDRQ